MRFFALASDYDGTLAHHGQVGAATIAALERFASSGRKLVMVTGRELDELISVFPRLDLFHLVVAENGALLYDPKTRVEKKLAEPPPPAFVRELRARGVERVSVGRVIVATWEPHETTVLEVIKDLGLELQVIFNKGAVMILPSGVNKATGLRAALEELGLGVHNCVGVGDAENDHAFLHVCECGVAVSNALGSLKKEADLVTAKDHGAGVTELIERILEDDLEGMSATLRRHYVLLGHRHDGAEVRIRPYGSNVLVAGRSGSGKTATALAIVERLHERKYQFCLIGPRGDHDDALDCVVSLGDPARAPTCEEVMRVLADPERSAAVSLVGIPLHDRPRFFGTLLTQLQDLRARTGRPHWIVVDEAHHLLPDTLDAGMLPRRLSEALLVTAHPSHVAKPILDDIDVTIAVGEHAGDALFELAQATGQQRPKEIPPAKERGEALVWTPKREPNPFRVRVVPSNAAHRHRRPRAGGARVRDSADEAVADGEPREDQSRDRREVHARDVIIRRR